MIAGLSQMIGFGLLFVGIVLFTEAEFVDEPEETGGSKAVTMDRKPITPLTPPAPPSPRTPADEVNPPRIPTKRTR